MTSSLKSKIGALFLKKDVYKLKDMMDYFASGADMKEERQYLASTEGVANADGSSGKKIHEYID